MLPLPYLVSCSVGGSVQDMVWDTTGHRLAIIFTRKAVLNIKCCKVIIPVCMCVCVCVVCVCVCVCVCV